MLRRNTPNSPLITFKSFIYHTNSKPPVKPVVCTYHRRVRLPAHTSTGIEVWQRITISGSRYVAAVFFAYLFLIPVYGSCTRLCLFGLSFGHSLIEFLYTRLLLFYFVRPYPRNTLYTKNSYFRTYILNLHVYRISLWGFSP